MCVEASSESCHLFWVEDSGFAKGEEPAVREQAVEKKYPGTYKRHPVRPIIHANTMEKLMKKRGVSHKPGGQIKRPDLLRSDGISNSEVGPSGSPLSGSPKMSTANGKSRYRSKPRHRRGNSKGSYSDFAGILKNQPAQDDAYQPPNNHQHCTPHHGHHPPLNIHGQDVANCANNLRYFGPAAALRSPLSNHAQRRMSGSSPDLISAAMEADSRRNMEEAEGSKASQRECCKGDMYDLCPECRLETKGLNQGKSLEPGLEQPEESQHNPLYANVQFPGRSEGSEFSTHQSSLGSSHSMSTSGLLCKTRPLPKSGEDSSEEEGEVDSEVEFPRRKSSGPAIAVCSSRTGECWVNSTGNRKYITSLAQLRRTIHRPHRCISSCQSYSTFSSENLSVSDGEEGNTSDHSNSPDELANRREVQLAEKLDEMMSQTPEIPIEISTQSDGLSDKESAVRRVKTQISLGKLCSDEHGYENPGEFGETGDDSSDGECSDATVRTNKACSSATW